MKTINLYNTADRKGITVERFDLPLVLSVSASNMQKCFVAIDNKVTAAQERVCLAHELGHCETMSFYNINSPLDVRGKHERRADRWAIGKLVPFSEYKKALKKGYTKLNELAEYFDVTPEFMQKVVDYYKERSEVQ